MMNTWKSMIQLNAGISSEMVKTFFYSYGNHGPIMDGLHTKILILHRLNWIYIYIYYCVCTIMYIYIHTLYTYIGWSENMVPLNPLVKHNFLYQNGDFFGYTGTSHSQTRPYSCSALPRILCIDSKNERTSTLHAVYFPYHVTAYIHCVCPCIVKIYEDFPKQDPVI